MLSACAVSFEASNPCIAAVKHHLAAGGGRVRARICLEAGWRLGLTESDAVCLAAVCEFLHNASLVQDDLLDRAASRRGAPSVWLKFGETVAVCTGDLMLSAAYVSLGEISKPELIPAALNLVHLRTRDVVLGQAAENGGQNRSAKTLEGYERLAIGKSASLLSLSLELPLLVAGHQNALDLAESTANAFAVGYQIFDDLQDVDQDERAGSLNVVLLLEKDDAMTRSEARAFAASRATSLLTAARHQAEQLPRRCASALVAHANKLHHGLASSLGSNLAVA